MTSPVCAGREVANVPIGAARFDADDGTLKRMIPYEDKIVAELAKVTTTTTSGGAHVTRDPTYFRND
jgi:hypothetical protein